MMIDLLAKSLAGRIVAKKPLAMLCVALCAASSSAMPSRDELKKVESVVLELIADDIHSMKAGKLKPSQVAANAEKLADEAKSEAAKFLLYKGAFGYYMQDGRYDEALRAIDRLKTAVKDVPDKVMAGILDKKLKLIPKKDGGAILSLCNLRDSIRQRMAAAEERGKLEKQLKASPADKQARRLLAVRCAQMGDWKAAREHFVALGGKEAAAVKAEGSDIAEAADFWWSYQSTVDEDVFRNYAASLYRKAIDEGRLGGLKLALAKKRVAEIGGVVDAAAQKSRQAADDDKCETAANGREDGDWSLPKDFKGRKYRDFDLGDGEPTTFFAIPADKCVFGAWNGQGLSAHEVRITRPFWIAQFPVTARQFRLAGIDIPLEMAGGNIFEEKFADDKDALVLAVVPLDKAASCVMPYFDWLNRKFGSTLPKGWVFRPPTQGEHVLINEVCRAGAQASDTDRNKLWLEAVHAKGMFTTCQTFQDVQKLGWQLKFSPGVLFVGVSKFKKDRTFPDGGYYQVCLDRISLPGVDIRSFLRGIYDPDLTRHLMKVVDYKSVESDPFRYVADGALGTWIAIGGPWAPMDMRLTVPIRVVVGPDYVGEWKAKNGK